MTTEGWLVAVLLEAVVFLTALWWREKVHDSERQALLDRLMARDFQEYQESLTEKMAGGARSWLRRAYEKGGVQQKLPSPDEEAD